MEGIIISLLIVIAIAVVILFMTIMRQRKDIPKPDDTGFKLILEQINELNRVVDRKIAESSRDMRESMQAQLSASSRIVGEVTEKLTKLDDTNRQVVSFADQLRDLQDILKNPKQRGILGEYYLETLLKNVFAPDQYQMQYRFKNGDIVDAVIFVRGQIIPIDSKFSLENYKKLANEKNPAEREYLEKLLENDLKNRIQETSKYIRPEENTMDFAFMFIPHEAVYYDLLTKKIGSIEADSLIQRAAGKYKVFVVSPTSFLAYLQTVLKGLNALKIEEGVKEVIKRVGELGMHLKKYDEYHTKLGKHLGTVVNHYNDSSKEFKKIDKDIIRITGSSPSLETTLIDRPEETE